MLNESSNPKNYIPDEQVMDRACSCSLGSDYLEFKRHMFGEVLLLKEVISNKTKSVSEDNCGGTVNCEQNYIRSLQERIYSLERQLEQKQSIIEKLLDVNEIRDRSHNRYEMPMGEEPPQHRHTSTQKSKESWNLEHPEVDLKKGKQKSFGIACTTAPDNRQHKKTKNKKKVKESRNSTVDRHHDDMATVNKKIKITIVGDSQLRFLNTEKMSNSHHTVSKDFKPGMKIREAIQTTGKNDSDVIIIHASTNNVSKTSPEELSEEIMATLDKIQENNPRAKIVYSAAFRRKDSHELNAKICQVNKILSEEIPAHGFDIIPNENILFSNLSNDGLHLNEGGVRKFAGNLIPFIKYY